jgi:hypothetical protein
MSNNLLKSDNGTLFLTFCILLVFILLILPAINNKNSQEQFELYENFDDLQDIASNSLDVIKVDKNICSKQCCKFEQWPVPFNTTNPNVDPNITKNFIGTNLSCNYGPDGGGCLCMTKNDFNYIANHGQSLSEKYDNPAPSSLPNSYLYQ